MIVDDDPDDRMLVRVELGSAELRPIHESTLVSSAVGHDGMIAFGSGTGTGTGAIAGKCAASILNSGALTV